MLQIRDEDGLYNEQRAGSDPRLTQGRLASHKRQVAADRGQADNSVME